MVTKRTKLVYEFTGVSVSPVIEIDFSTLEMDDGNTFDEFAAAYFGEVTALTTNASFTGMSRRAFGVGVGAIVGPTQSRGSWFGSLEFNGGNAGLLVSATTPNTITIDTSMASLTPTDMKVWVEIVGYSND